VQKTDRFEYSQSYLEHGYKELTIPSAAACGFAPDDSRIRAFDGFAMEPNALHIWPRGGFMMIALPNKDRTFTCTCFWPFIGANGLESLRRPDEVRDYFGRVLPDAVPLMPTLADDYLRNPNGSLVTVRCAPWFYKDKIVLLGDAAHAIVPFFGQGMNAAFEDCVALDECIRKLVRQGDRPQADWGAAFAEFFRRRKEHADAIADMALHNFIEMRDHTASRRFLLKKKFEQAVHKLLPGWFKPLYNMISFSTVPYAEARRIARRQQAIVYSALVAIVVIIVIVIGVVVGAVV
jgi:kynurenine 3-monooxygenase